MTYISKIVIIGSGPAGLLISRYCSEMGLNTTLISPDIYVPWKSNFCFWVDEIEEVHYNKYFLKTWKKGLVFSNDGKSTVLDRTYALLDTRRLQSDLLRRCKKSGVHFIQDRINDVTHNTKSSILKGHNNRYECSIVIDATGNSGSFIKGRKPSSPAYQLAYGQHIRCSLQDIQHHWDLCTDSFVFMDFRNKKFQQNIPTFLYVLPIAKDQIFIEETILTTKKQINQNALQLSLAEKRKELGLFGVVVQEEFCKIKMGSMVPNLNQRVLGFGVAAGLVHPVTGYQISRSINLAPKIASCIAENIHDPQKAVNNAWKIMWPRDIQRMWSLYNIGHEVMCDFNHEQMQQFFSSFFSLEHQSLHKFISANGTTTDVTSTMWNLFLQLDWNSRGQLLKSIFKTNISFT